jgi:hypothetical protein
MSDARRFEYQRMTGDEFRRSMDAISLSVNTFSRIFGFNPKRIHSWLEGNDNIPPWVPVVMAILGSNPMAIVAARQEAAERIVSDSRRDPNELFPYLEKCSEDEEELGI